MLDEEDLDALFEAICEGDRETVVALVTKARDAGADLGTLLNDVMIPAMTQVGEEFSRGEIFVPEMLVAARAMQGGIDVIEPVFAAAGRAPAGRLCIGTVKGDVHDIGKNLVTMMLKGAGYEVEDLGVDVRIDEFERAVVERGHRVICLSALLTTTKPQMKTVVDHFRARNDVRIVIGGAVVTQDYADQIGAHGFAEDAPGAVKAVRQCLESLA
mgnify:CR=1 FL=1